GFSKFRNKVIFSGPALNDRILRLCQRVESIRILSMLAKVVIVQLTEPLIICLVACGIFGVGHFRDRLWFHRVPRMSDIFVSGLNPNLGAPARIASAM